MFLFRLFSELVLFGLGCGFLLLCLFGFKHCQFWGASCCFCFLSNQQKLTPGPVPLSYQSVGWEEASVALGTSIPGFPTCSLYFLASEQVGITISIALCE